MVTPISGLTSYPTAPTRSRSAPHAPTRFNPDVYYAAAFLAGFAESPFRALVKRLTHAVFGPGPSKPRTDDNSHG